MMMSLLCGCAWIQIPAEERMRTFHNNKFGSFTEGGANRRSRSAFLEGWRLLAIRGMENDVDEAHLTLSFLRPIATRLRMQKHLFPVLLLFRSLYSEIQKRNVVRFAGFDCERLRHYQMCRVAADDGVAG
jgi:hypothetical protein